jgi:hypothetical protein
VLRTLLLVVYLLIGVAVANANGYLGHLGDVERLVSAALAILLWPLVLLGVNLHIGGLVKNSKR